MGMAAPGHSQDISDLLNTPPMDPCALFEGNDDVVTFFIDMDLEGGEVEMRVPKVFLEDPHDHQDGVCHGSQLFRVMIDNFLPMTRRQTSEFNRAGTWERGKPRYTWFVVGDILDLDRIAALSLKRMLPKTPERPISDYEFVPFDHGLLKAVPSDGEVQKDVFLAYSNEGDLSSVLTCSADGTVTYPFCTHFFRSSEMDVQLNFAKPYLSEWQKMRNDVDRFFSCATNTQR